MALPLYLNISTTYKLCIRASIYSTFGNNDTVYDHRSEEMNHLHSDHMSEKELIMYPFSANEYR